MLLRFVTIKKTSKKSQCNHKILSPKRVVLCDKFFSNLYIFNKNANSNDIVNTSVVMKEDNNEK